MQIVLIILQYYENDYYFYYPYYCEDTWQSIELTCLFWSILMYYI